MRVVLDTNVLVSGILTKGTSRKILDIWYDRKFDLIVGPEIFQEYHRVLFEINGRYNLDVDISEILATIGTKAIWISPISLIDQICDDPDDDKFIAAAISGNAQFVVTGDKALLRVGSIAGADIITPSQFINNF